MTTRSSITLLLAAALLAASAAAAGAITDVRFQITGATQSNVPVTFGQVFAAGDMKKSDVLVGKLAGATVPLQVDVKATHADGSVRHAIISAIIPKLAAGATGTMTLNAGGVDAASTHRATPADLLAAGFTASASATIAGVKYSASADQLLKAGAKATWLAGAVVNEWQVVAPLTTTAGVAHPHLTARFAVRYYSALNKARVDVTIENAWAYEPGPQNFTYDAEILVGGKAVYSKTGLTHYHHARWRKLFWWGGDAPAVNVQSNVQYLISTRAVPNYDQAPGVSPSLLASYAKNTAVAAEPMTLVYASPYMPTTGANEGIGLMPAWAAAYVLSMDKAARDVTLSTGDLAGSYSMHYRDRVTDRPVSLANYPYMTTVGRPTDTFNPTTKAYESFPACAGDCATPFTHDTPHQPSLAYVPYLMTGDYYYLEELQFWAAYNTLSSNPGYRQYGKGLFASDQVRGQSWSMRTLAEVAAITPDADPLKSSFVSILNSNVDWYISTYVSPGDPAYANKLGVITNGYALGYLNNTALAPWQDDFFTSAIGHMVDLGFAQAKPLLDWKSKFPVGRMTAPGVCWIDAVVYAMVVRDKDSSPIYDTYAKAQAATRGADFMKMPCGGAAMASFIGGKIGDMGGISNGYMGYPSNMQPALAYSVDAGLPDAKRAWDLFQSRTVKPDCSMGPQFCVVPRSYAAATVAPIVDNTPQQTWKQIGKEGDTVTVPAGTTVRYGANGYYVTKTVGGAVTASNAFFGKDPAVNAAKVLEQLSTDAAAPVVAPPAVTPAPSPAAKPGKVTTPTNTKLKSLKGLTAAFFDPAKLAQVKVFAGATSTSKGALTFTDAALLPGVPYAVIVSDAGGKVLDVMYPINAN
ncbi:hypothetical protein [Massilia sp. S19_KUP03_FR1]|uniref:hypothetical protein n=1 Tax=Massilia sp. S19_KUP03_FR1 TaxID=3025503 RepID=UPI002FCD2511